MLRRCTYIFTAMLVLLATINAQRSAREAIKTFRIADGLEWHLFASEPMFTNPTCIDVDHKGRVWVCESVNYRCRLRNQPLNRPAGDRIVVLEDADGDGRADRATTFYQFSDFVAPLGIAVAPYPDKPGQRIYVCHSPYIYLFEDTNDDLQADDKPRILVQGFRGYDHDHGVHGIHFGADGKLYFTCGDAGIDGIRDRWGKVWKTNSTDCRAGTVWRCDPEGANLEMLAHNFRNQYEPAIDSFGTLFVSDNDDDGSQQSRICHVLFGGNYGYWPRGPRESHWHEEQPGVVHKVLRTWFGSPTGMAWYEGNMIPWTGGRNAKEYYGRLLHTDAGPRQVRIYYVRIKGSGFDIDREDIVTSEDNWFRPSDICVAPDGSIFVSDWYDPGVGGHGMGDTARGRIYRLTSKGQLTYRIRPPDYSHEHGILVALRSPNLATRFGGWQAAQRLDTNHLARLLCKEIEKESDLTVCARLAWLLTRTDDWYEYWPLLAQKSDDVRWLMMLVRIAKDRAGKLYQAPQKIQHWLESQIRAETPLPVLREIALALRDETPQYAKPMIYKLARLYPGQEHFYLVSLGIAVGHYDAARRQVLLEDFEKFFPTWDERSLDLIWEWRPPQVIAQLDKYILNTRLPLEQRQRLVDVLAHTDGTSGGEVMLRVLTAPEPAIRGRALHWCKLYLPTKWSSLRTSRQLELLINDWLERQNLAASAMELITSLESEAWIPKLSALAAKEQNPVDLRRQALETLGAIRSPQASEALARFLSSPDLAKTAINSLGRQGTSNALRILTIALRSKDQEWEIKMDIVAALASFRAGALWLLEHIQELEAPVRAEAIRWLRNSPFQDLRNKALIMFPVTKLSPQRLPEIAQLVLRRGDVQNGKRLFFENKDLGCSRCHVVNGQGGKIGPELSTIGSKASKENLYESILYPDRAIADQFIQWLVETKQGVAVQGILVEETPNYLVLRDANGKDWKITKQDIMERIKSPRSLMPSDLVQYMSEQDLVDLVEFLQTLRSSPEKKP